MSLQLHRPDGRGGIQPRTVEDRNWRRQLQSPRWGARLRGGRLPDLRNVEMNPTSGIRALAPWLVLGAITFVVLVLGYGTGFWA